MSGALSHLRVLDLSRVLAGPWASQCLADLGATVFKIERPGEGDDTRRWGPPWVAGQAAYFLSTNRGKRSVTIDFTQPTGQALLRELVQSCDVVIENFKVGGLAKYGLDYESLRALNPRLVYCSITGFGQDGPYRQRAGYDFMIQGLGGLMSVTGEADADGGNPVKVGVAVADVFTGLYATIGILAALAERERSGEGQHVDMALLDVQVAVLANQALNYLASGQAPQRLGNAHPNIVPYQAFATQDGHLILAVGNDGQFRRFAEIAGHPEWAADERFASNPQRVAHRRELVPLVAAAVAARTTGEWLALLEPAGVPCGPINDLAQVFADPQVIARGLRIEQPTPAGPVPGVASPIRLSRTPIAYDRAPPQLGQDTEAVLARELGVDEKALAQLREGGVI